MSVPLDRLYNFLHDVCNHRDVIIYRFFPHGSRKITDLTLLDKINERRLVTGNYNDNFVFFHDQEPLNFDLYRYFDIDSSRNRLHLMDDELFSKHKDLGERVMPEMNLKWAAGLFLWRHPVLLVHSEQRSAELEKYNKIQCVGVYWWCHALIARDWFRYAEHDLLLLDKKSNTKDFLIYNRAWSGTREYRLKFTELLIEHNLADYCMTWFSPVDDIHYTKHSFKNPSLQINKQNFEDFFVPTQVNSNASADYCSDDYQQTNVEIVLETLFDDQRLHLTEKILRPIACGHPFMLAATHGSLEYLRSYGFETFAPWIDESYDNIENPVQRLEAIVQEMKRIASLSEVEKNVLYAGLKKIATRNKNLFFSQAWQEKIIDEFKTNFAQGVEKINQF